MDTDKKKALEESFERIINVGFCIVPYEDLSDIIVEDPFVFGTTKDERISSFEGVKELFESQFEQMKGLEPALSRNRIATHISPDGNNAFIVEENILTLTSPDEVNSIFLRISCVMEYMDNRWKLTHWHTSTPVDTENDHWHQEEWKREKEKLQKLVDEQTANLHAKNRELEIEAALERVRARTMAMQNSEELADAAFVLFEQLRELGGNLWGTGFGLCEKDSDTDTFWFANENGVFPPVSIPNTTDPAHKQMFEGWEAGESFLSIEASGEDLKSHYDYMLSLPEVRPFFQKIINEGLSFPEWQQWNAAYFKHGYLLIITLEPYPDPDILVRFAKVFDQTYTRFLDLKKAEAQAREAEIQLALERVRAKAMAMHDTSDLANANSVVFDELTSLGISPLRSGIGLLDAETRMATLYATVLSEQQNNLLLIGEISLTNHNVLESIFEGWVNKEIYHVELNGKELEQYYEMLLSSYGDLPKPEFSNEGTQHGYFIPFEHGSFYAWTREPYDNEALRTIERFTSVINLTYNRYFDLQKAEAQAREAQINLAVERVRAKALAMHKSEEILQVVNTLKNEIIALDIPSVSAATIHLREKDGRYRIWDLTSIEETKKELDISLDFSYRIEDTHPDFFIREVWEKTDNYFVVIQGSDRYEHTVQWLKDNGYAEEARDFVDFIEETNIEKAYHPTVSLQKGRMCIDMLEEPSPEVGSILKKMGQAFDLAYKRFEDLQKAEDQAREAQIETALEKIRSRTMAMQKGDELQDVAVLLYKELIALGVTNFVTCGYVEVNEDIQRQHTWVTAPGGDTMGLFHLPLTGDNTFDARYAAWKKQQLIFHQSVAGQVRNDHLEYAITTFNSKEAEEMVRSQFPDPTVFYCFNFSHGYLHIVGGSLLEKEEELLLARFTKVFEQTYTRFLDLRKAEEQAREATIEMSLEKIRSRTMGMQSSDELPEVANLLFLEIQALGIPAWSCGYCILEEDRRSSTCIMSSEGTIQKPFLLPHGGEASFEEWDDFVHSDRTFFTKELEGEAIESHYDFMTSLPQLQPVFQDLKDEGLTLPTYQINHLCKFTHGFLLFITYEPVPDAHDIFKRFTKVFEQTYTRFLDLEKSEAQARESEIQLALERVRARSMAMQSSDELVETAELLFQQVKELGIELWSCGFSLWYDDDTYFMGYNPGPDGKMGPPLKIPLTEDIFFKTIREAKRKGEEFLVFESEGESLAETYAYMDTLPVVGDVMRGFVEAGFDLPTYQVTHCGFFPQGHLMFITQKKYPEAHDIFKRFTKEFERTYTRFLDLQKAEEQTRQAQINLALERVRARSLAMQKPDDLNKVNEELLRQLQELHIDGLSGVSIWLLDEEGQITAWDLSNPGNMRDPRSATVRYNATKFDLIGEPWRIFNTPDINYVVLDYPVEKLRIAVKEWEEVDTSIANEFQEALDNGSLTHQWNPLARHSHGFLSIDLVKPPSGEIGEIVTKMASAFSLAYRRFLDLQKAEEQAREAQIEAALERVRSRSLAMHKTDELQEVVQVVAEELKNTGVILDTGGAVICTYFQDSKDVMHWTATEDPSHPSVPYLLPYFEDELFDDAWASKNRGDDYFAKEFSYDVKNSFWEYAFEHSDYRQLPDEYKKVILESESHGLAWAWSENSAIMIPNIQGDLPSEEEKKILIRFANVFEQAYVRFLDLQKAEEQARESEIQLALERVRARTMAMQHSDELQETSYLLDQQVRGLGIKTWGCAFNIYRENDSIEWFGNEKGILPTYTIPREGIFKEYYHYGQEGKSIHIQEFSGQECIAHYEYMSTLPVIGDVLRQLKETNGSFPEYQIDHVVYFKYGYLLFITVEAVPEETHKIFKRFTKEFERTYTRFLDLQKAENQAYKSKVEASLERVRGMAAAMNHSDDLLQIAEAVFKELEILKINPLRYGLGMIDGDKKEAELWASTVNDGHYLDMLGTLSLTWHPMLQQVLEAWDAQHEELIYNLKGRELSDYYRKVGTVNPGIPNLEELQDPNTDIEQYVSFFPFKSGALYAFTQGEPGEDGKSILKRFANVFEQAHIRYDDLQIAEKQARLIREERDRLEIALKELEATQDQLVQQEKLASLGQLTAGIAHEIKNPLNFVNNFSEVSVELIEETKEELSAVSDQLSAEDRENVDEALEILQDIEMNLRKIHEHGSRADSIVKSMLQHSRGGDGTMEPTDINPIIKEYVNLAFHGMRAGKEPINVDIELDLDENAGNVPLIAEDFSRVVLNIVNNAFDAMREKLKNPESRIQDSGEYQPVLMIRTSRKDSTITIEFQDNGPGIPEEMKDKILQPFFTTKKERQAPGWGCLSPAIL